MIVNQFDAMLVEWKKVKELSDGHGVMFIYLPINKAIAFIDGYEWFRGNQDIVVVEILEDSSVLFKKYNLDVTCVLNNAKETVNYFLSHKNIQDGKFVNEYFRVWFNA